ncbi:hypothetical protein [Streptomyces sp. NPDC006610]|uniref:hypothetical protein n=1 Tax=Streptomyces sp. NPDC006610 TaxID=3154584 RepID=UPI0033A785AE
MVPAKIEVEGTDVLRVRRPSTETVGIGAALLAVAGDVANVIPEGPASGAVIAGAAAVYVAKRCLYRP